jgi:FADH2 O2-dependent halogenase
MHMPQPAFRSGRVTGPHWALLPSAAGFVDPLLSTGFTLTLLGLARLAEIIERHWDEPEFATYLQSYGQSVTNELLAVEQLVAALYAAFGRFNLFTRLPFLYFAAVSYAEITARVHPTQPLPSFLLQEDAGFAPRARECCERALRLRGHSPLEESEISQAVLKTIGPVDLIGLANPARKNWYPVVGLDTEDVSVIR